MRQNPTIARLLFTLLCMLALLGGALPALAEPVSTVAEIRVAAQMLESHPIVFVVVVLDEDTPLPAQAPIAVPAGSRMDWVGELTGGDVTEDPETTHTLLETRDGWDIYLVDFTQNRAVQVEASLTEPYLVTTGEYTGTAAFTYVPATAARELTVAAETPPSLSGFDENAGYEVLGQGIGGGMIIGPTFTDAKAGEPYAVSFSFSTTPSAGENTEAGGIDSFAAVMIALVLALVVLVAILLFILNKQRGGKLAESVADSTAPRKAQEKRASGRKPDARGPERKGFRWNSPQMLVIGLIALAFIGMLIWTSQRNANTITENNGVFSQVFAVGDPCQSVELQLTDAALQNPQASARELFTLMRTADIPLLSATLDSNSGILMVEFCESYAKDSAVVALLESSGMIAGSSLKTLNMPIVRDGGILMWYFAQQHPCATNVFEIADPKADAVAFIEQLAQAVRAVPSITGVAWDPANRLAEFGFCEESADDDMIAEALAAAGIDATLESPASALTGQSVFAQY